MKLVTKKENIDDSDHQDDSEAQPKFKKAFSGLEINFR